MMRMQSFSRHEALDTPQFAVVQDVDPTIELDYTYLRFKANGVRIVALDRDGRVLLVRQNRYPVAQKTWEIPAGGIESSETPLQAAKRELREEAGLVASTWTPLSSLLPLPNMMDFVGHFFVAQGLEELRDGMPDEPAYQEVVETSFCDTAALYDLIRREQLIDEKSIAALTLVDVFRDRLI